MNNLQELKRESGINIYKHYLPDLREGQNIYCKFHDDKKTKSLSIFRGDSGEYLFNCFGCGDTGDIIKFIEKIEGINSSDAIRRFKELANGNSGNPSKTTGQSKKENKPVTRKQIKELRPEGYKYHRGHIYDDYLKAIYKDGKGNKTALFFHQVDKGKDLWAYGRGGKAVLYNQKALYNRPDDIVLIPEGENDTDTLTNSGYLSVTSGGTDSFKPSINGFKGMLEALRHREILLFPDNDDVGYKELQLRANHLQGTAKSIKQIDLKKAWIETFNEDAPEKSDITDFVNRYKTVKGEEGLKAVVDQMIDEAEVINVTDVIINSEEEIIYSDDKIISVTPFPFDVFPEQLRSLIEKIRIALQVNPEMVASVMFAIIVGCIGSTVRVSPKHNWLEPLFIWLMIIGVTGSGKSPLINLLMQYIEQRQAKAFKQYQKEHKEYVNEVRRIKREKTDEPLPEEPVIEHSYISNFTMEVLTQEIFKNSPRGIISYKDELGSLINALNQYKGTGDDRQTLLNIYNAKQLQIDRKGITVTIPNSGMSVIGGIQNKMLPEIFRFESHSEGMTPRFLMCLLNETKSVSFSRQGISDDDLKIWESLIDYCYKIPLNQNDEGYVEPTVLILNEYALNYFEAFYNEYHALRPFFSEQAQGFIPKLIGYSLRLAGILHVIKCFNNRKEHVRGVIDAETMAGAIKLTEYYAGQAIEALKLYGKDERLNEYQVRIIRVLYSLKEDVESGRILFKKIVEAFNSGLPERLKHTPWKVKGLTKTLELKTDHGTSNKVYLLWESETIKKLFSKINFAKNVNNVNYINSKTHNQSEKINGVNKVNVNLEVRNERTKEKYDLTDDDIGDLEL